VANRLNGSIRGGKGYYVKKLKRVMEGGDEVKKHREGENRMWAGGSPEG